MAKKKKTEKKRNEQGALTEVVIVTNERIEEAVGALSGGQKIVMGDGGPTAIPDAGVLDWPWKTVPGYRIQQAAEALKDQLRAYRERLEKVEKDCRERKRDKESGKMIRQWKESVKLDDGTTGNGAEAYNEARRKLRREEVEVRIPKERPKATDLVDAYQRHLEREEGVDFDEEEDEHTLPPRILGALAPFIEMDLTED